MSMEQYGDKLGEFGELGSDLRNLLVINI